MSRYFQNPDFYNKPVSLPDEYRNDPVAFLEHFFSDYHLIDLRSFLDEILETCLTTDNPPFDKPEKRADIILLHKNIELLFEAAFMLLPKKGGNEVRQAQKQPNI